ncbi:MAG: class I SAM-dependent methyltransferase [Syntrophomonadaceae bacterium]|nr:class I SAM-dependent methyltransferase [Syntrophomonadaceae bacterium]
MLRGDEDNSRIVAFSPEVYLVIVPSKERFAGPEVLGDTVLIDYPLRPEPRYGYGKPPHSRLNHLLNRNRPTYIKNLEYIWGLRALFREIPAAVEEPASIPRWHNPWISGFDAITLCSFLARNNPRRYVEIGSGESTRFARWTINRLQLRTRITSIDPNPRGEIDSLCDRLLRKRVENIDLSIFSELQPGDIIFVDSSHRVLMNSDATVVFLDVLPNLRPGVLVHFHDIFLPDDYPPEWIGRYYSEQYLLAAYLLAGGEAIEVLQPNHFISRDPELSRFLAPLWEDMPHITGHGASFWFRADAGSARAAWEAV